MDVSDREFWSFDMADFLRIRTAFFAKNGLDEDGRDADYWDMDKFEEFNARIVKAWEPDKKDN